MHQRKGYMTLQKTGEGTYWKYRSVVRALYSVSRRSAEVSSRPANTNKYKDLTATHCRNILTFQEELQ